MDDLLTISGDRLAIFHINDIPASPPPTWQTDSDRVMVGDGIADLRRAIANLRTISYRGPISLELFNEALWAADPAEVCTMPGIAARIEPDAALVPAFAEGLARFRALYPASRG